MNYRYRIYPDARQEQMMLDWLEISRKVYNYALGEIKDWVNSRKCSLDYCSLSSEYIIRADKPFPTYYNQQNALPRAKKEFEKLTGPPSQVLQTTIRRLHEAWNYFQQRGFGFPRFKKFGHTGKKELSERVHKCDVCGYETDRDHAAAEVIRLRGLELAQYPGTLGRENAYAVGLPGVEEKSPSRSEAKPLLGKTRNAKL